MDPPVDALRPPLENFAIRIWLSSAPTAMIDTEFAGTETGSGSEGRLLSFPAAAITRQLLSRAFAQQFQRSSKVAH